LNFYFNREGKFYRNDLEHLPIEIAKRFIEEMTQWIDIQKEIYTKDLEIFQKQHPEETFASSISTGMESYRFPHPMKLSLIRELFTQLAIVENREEKEKEKTPEKKKKTKGKRTN